MYYVVLDDCEQARIFHSSEPGTFKKFVRMNAYKIIVETDNILHASMNIEYLSDEEVKRVHHRIEVEIHNEPILKRLEQLDKELPKTITMVPPVTYIGFRTDESTFSEAKKRIDKFLEEWNMLINSGYKQIGTTVSGYTLCPPNYDEVLHSQSEERERLKADLWE